MEPFFNFVDLDVKDPYLHFFWFMMLLNLLTVLLFLMLWNQEMFMVVRECQ